jgi:hypothetical protein
MSNDPLIYVQEKFELAVYSLVRFQPLKDRLENAQMHFYPVKQGDFKNEPELGEAYGKIIARLTAKEERTPGEGTVRSTIDQMSDLEAQEVADQIVGFTFDVIRRLAEKGT